MGSRRYGVPSNRYSPRERDGLRDLRSREVATHAGFCSLAYLEHYRHPGVEYLQVHPEPCGGPLDRYSLALCNVRVETTLARPRDDSGDVCCPCDRYVCYPTQCSVGHVPEVEWRGERDPSIGVTRNITSLPIVPHTREPDPVQGSSRELFERCPEPYSRSRLGKPTQMLDLWNIPELALPARGNSREFRYCAASHTYTSFDEYCYK